MAQVLPKISSTSGWFTHLHDQFDQPYMLKLSAFLQRQQQQEKIIYPAFDAIFNAFDQTPFDQLKVVILGQDPYHGEGQAHGLSFSVSKDVKIPPSLVNIYKELHSDVGIQIPEHGNLQSWTKQGVLLLNSVLTVEHQQAGAHQGKGWEQFTDVVIKRINDHAEHVVFLLWGSYAQKKGRVIDSSKHLVLSAPHPSPLSAYRGFLGCKHFSASNAYLQQHGKTAINWQV